MAYTLLWMRNERVVGMTSFKRLASAKAHAEQNFEDRQNQQGVDRAEVRNDADELVFQIPMTLHRA
jgi:hypothetical protein